jgi:hypothetical protein
VRPTDFLRNSSMPYSTPLTTIKTVRSIKPR